MKVSSPLVRLIEIILMTFPIFNLSAQADIGLPENFPDITVNVYDDPEYSAIQKELHKRLDELRVQYQDDSDARNQEWIVYDLERMNR